MTRRLLVVLIALIGTAGVVVAVLAVFFPEEDRTELAQPGPVRDRVAADAGKVDVSVELNTGGNRTITAVTGAGTIRIHPR